MGRNGTLNKNSNLTWEFNVDSGFNYLLRLHFCEMDPNVQQVRDRVFLIYIAEQLAETAADILTWTHEWAAATYRDYVVNIVPGGQKFVKLTLTLGTVQEVSETHYYDAILMGLEIFKISDGGSNLAGPNPDPHPSFLNPPESDLPLQNQKKSSTATIGIVAGVVSGVVLISIVAVVAFFIIGRGKKVKDSKSSTDRTSKWAPFSISTTKSTKSRGSSSLPADLCRYFSIAEIRAATNNFDDVFIIGVGGFGNVYKGYIDDGSTQVAIKRLKPGSQQGAHEFKTEIEMLSQLRHLHLVSLIGYCNESNEMILVYDFMARGTFRDHLYNTDNPSLSWKQRLQICIGAARGLHYLHTGAKYTIIHRDVKSTNILLDEKWVAKVSDFGLSRIGPTGISKAHVSTVVKGSVGYLDPEYYKRQRLTEKSDVYSFGVVLFEILCARPALIRTAEKKQVSLADWARHCFHVGTLLQIVDPAMKGKIAPECLRKFGEVAVSCLMDDGSHRPSMNDVVWGLEFALQLQESAERREQGNVGDDNVVERGDNNGDSDDMFSSNTSVGQVSDYRSSSGVSITSSGESSSRNNSKETDRLISATVFSEIMDPTAR